MSSSKACGDGTKTIQHVILVNKTMHMCEHYLTRTYSTIFGTSSCICIGIAGCFHYNQLYPVLKKDFGYSVNSDGTMEDNERVVPVVSYKLAGWCGEFPNAIGILRKGIKVYGNGPIRWRKKIPALRQVALEYPRQIFDWKFIFRAGSRPNIYIYFR